MTCQVKLKLASNTEESESETNGNIATGGGTDDNLNIDEEGNVEHVSAAKKALIGVVNPNDPVHCPRITQVHRIN